MTTSPRTVFTVADRFLGPLESAVPGRLTAKQLYDQLPEFAGSGGVCGVAVGLFPGRDEPWRVAFFDDLICAGVTGTGGRESWLTVDRAAGVFEKAFETLPECPPAWGREVRLEADERGRLLPGQEGQLRELLEAARRRPRLGTVLIETAHDHGDHMHMPEGALALVDDDLGRHLLVLARWPDDRWRLLWAPGDAAGLARALQEGVGDRA